MKKTAVLLLIVVGCISCASVIIITQEPISQNVSSAHVGPVQFTCATNDASQSINITWHTEPAIIQKTIVTDLPEGGKLSTLDINELTDITVTCVITDTITNMANISNKAQLLVQGLLSGVGNLTSSEVDHCTLHFTWTAPYTLQGVPINYYTINITRHSDGAVLKEEKPNTTEYLYTVNSLGETLEVVVAAVNSVDIGNTSSIITQTPSTNNVTNISLTDTTRNNSKWSFSFTIRNFVLCKNPFIAVTVEACNSSSCVSVNITGIMNMSADGVRRVMATFTNLEENRKYSASVYVQYNGRVVQQSQSVEISTSDLMNLIFVPTKQCFNVTAIYVTGHAVNSSFVCFKSTSNEGVSLNTTVGNWKCIHSLTTNEFYNVLGIDSDSPVADINTSPAVNLTGVYAPMFPHVAVAETSTTTSSESPVPTIVAEPSPHQWIWILIVVLVVVVAIAVICIIIITYLCWTKFNTKRVAGKRQPEVNKMHQHEMSNAMPETKSISGSDQTCNQQETQYSCIEHKDKVYNTLEVDTNVEYGTIETTLPEKECVDHLHNMPKSLELDHSTVYGLLKPLSNQWNDLGEELGLSSHLSEIKSMFHENEQRLSEVLRIWEHSSIRSYSWNTLATALESKKISRLMLASEIKKALRGTKL